MPFFTAPLFLLAGLTALVPLVLHLRHRRKPKPVPFSTVRFLQAAMARTRKSRKVSNILILLLRMLILLLLACAFAQPVVRSGEWLAQGQRTAVIIIDASASMKTKTGNNTGFSLAVERARKLVRRLDGGNRVALIAAGKKNPQILFPPISDHDQVIDALDNLPPGYGTVDLNRTMEKVAEKLDSGTGVEFHVFSDFQTSNITQGKLERLTDLKGRGNVPIICNKVITGNVPNASIRKVQLQPPAVLGNKELQLTASVTRNKDFKGNTSISVLVDGEKFTQRSLALSNTEQKDFSITFKPPTDTPSCTGKIQLATDAFPPDNKHYFSVPKMQGVSVLIVDGNKAEENGGNNSFLRNALNPAGGPGTLFEPEVVSWQKFVAKSHGRYETIIITNPPQLKTSVIERLTDFLKEGGCVMIFPGSRGADIFESVTQFSPLQDVEITPSRPNENKTFHLVSEGKNQADIVTRVREVLTDTPTLSPTKRLGFESLPSGTNFIFSYSDGTPFIFYIPLGNGRLYLSSVPASREWSDWPLTPFFVVTMQELVKSNVRRQIPKLITEIGTPLELPWPKHQKSLTLDITSPNNTVSTRQFKREKTDEPFLAGGFREPGFYKLKRENKTWTVGVNIPSEEKKLRYTGTEKLERIFAGFHPKVVTSWSAHRKQLEFIRRGRPLWPILFGAALLLLLIEAVTANLLSRSKPRPEGLKNLLGET